MGSVDKRLRREFDAHVDSIMDRSSKQLAYERDPDWKVNAYHEWLRSREGTFETPEPEPRISDADKVEMFDWLCLNGELGWDLAYERVQIQVPFAGDFLDLPDLIQQAMAE